MRALAGCAGSTSTNSRPEIRSYGPAAPKTWPSAKTARSRTSIRTTSARTPPPMTSNRPSNNQRRPAWERRNGGRHQSGRIDGKRGQHMPWRVKRFSAASRNDCNRLRSGARNGRAQDDEGGADGFFAEPSNRTLNLGVLSSHSRLPAQTKRAAEAALGMELISG